MEEEQRNAGTPQPTNDTHPIHAESPSGDEGTITLSQMTLWKTATFVLLGLFVLSLFTGGFGFNNDTAGPTGNVVAPTPAPTREAPVGNIKVSITDADPVLGDKDAGITIVEFSDFQCPFCSRAADGAVAEFKQSDYFKNGEVNLVYKHFPLNSIHPQAQKAAEASECANKQGKFWEYHDVLFANQQSLDIPSLKQYAQQVGLNTGTFDKCLENNEARSKVSQDLTEASSAGGRGTPYFVVVNNENKNTQAVSGAVPFAQIESAIQALQ
jgi:protein-disulfide isomerase